MAGENVLIFMKQGGRTMVSKGSSGAKIVPGTETQPANVSDLKVTYTTGDLDAEAEIIAALNATNTAVNAILAALEGIGIMASS